MTSFKLFEILNFIYFIFQHYLIFYLLKMIQYDKTFAYKSLIMLFFNY